MKNFTAASRPSLTTPSTPSRCWPSPSQWFSYAKYTNTSKSTASTNTAAVKVNASFTDTTCALRFSTPRSSARTRRMKRRNPPQIQITGSIGHPLSWSSRARSSLSLRGRRGGTRVYAAHSARPCEAAEMIAVTAVAQTPPTCQRLVKRSAGADDWGDRDWNSVRRARTSRLVASRFSHQAQLRHDLRITSSPSPRVTRRAPSQPSRR